MIDLGYQEDRTQILTADAQECPRCHVMRHLFINRNGRTLCLYCDEERYQRTAYEKDTGCRPDLETLAEQGTRSHGEY